LPGRTVARYTRLPEPRTGIDRSVRLALEREYDVQLSHTIWELERAIRRGATSESLRRTLVEAHAQHLRHMEDIAGVQRHQRSVLLLHPRPTDTVLLLPGEGSGADEVLGLGENLYKRGFAVLATSLSLRGLDPAAHPPLFWQTCADEIENRFDVMAHFSTRTTVVAVGMAAVVAMHVATTRRIEALAALFPTLGSAPGWVERLRATLRRLVLRDTSTPAGWAHQRQLAARAAHDAAAKIALPLYVLVEERKDRSEAARSAKGAQRLVHRAATRVRTLRPGEAASVRDLPPAVQEDLIAFLRPK
jgi:hypothetical protein